MAVDVLDSWYSWVVAVCGSLMYMIVYGLGWVSGLLLVATLNYFDTDRKTASFPFTFACALKFLAGPLAAFLAGKFGIRFVTIFGCFLSCVGVGACFMAETITMVAIFFGGLFGIGSCLSSSLIPQLNNLYFNKHLTKANGLSYAGSSISGFIFPPLCEFLLNEYGIKGTYLILAGILLNCIPVGMFMKEPPQRESVKEGNISKNDSLEKTRNTYHRKSSENRPCDQDQTGLRCLRNSSKSSLEDINNSLPHKDCDRHLCTNRMCFSNRLSSVLCNEMAQEATSSSADAVEDNVLSTGFLNFDKKEPSKTDVIINVRSIDQELQSKYVKCEETHSQFVESFEKNLQRTLKTDRKYKNFENEVDTKEELWRTNEIENASVTNQESPSKYNKFKSTQFDNLEKISQNTVNGNCRNPDYTSKQSIYYIESSKTNEISIIEKKKSGLKDLDVFLDIQFLLISFAASIDGALCFVLPTILNDYSMDKGFTLTDSTYLLMVLSITDLIGRLTFGWVTDNGYVSLSNFCTACFLSLAVCLFLVVWASELSLMFVILSFMGLGLGGLTPHCPCLITEFIKPERQSMANASLYVFSVPLLLLTPSLIGYFRDGLGSYDWFVYILCILSVICGLMYLALPYIKNRKNRKM